MPERALVYLDNNATTRPRREVLEAMLPFLGDRFANPSSAHALGAAVRRDVERTREVVAASFGAEPDEVVFTSGGTESIAGALWGAVALSSGRVVTTAVEHPSVRGAIAAATRGGREVATIGVDGSGTLDLAALEAALEARVALVTLVWANHETGVLFPVERIAALCRGRGALLHVDAVQAAGKLPIDLRRIPVDLLSVSAHKMHGPKGAGALVVRRGVRLPPLLGGSQERGHRGGTENVPGIIGFGVAADLAARDLAGGVPERLRRLRDRLERLLLEIPGTARNGAAEPRVPGTASLRFDGVDGASLVLELSKRGIAASSGSACASGDLEPSPVLLAMGLDAPQCRGALRLSLSWETTGPDIDAAASEIADAVRRLRRVNRAPAARSQGDVNERVHGS